MQGGGGYITIGDGVVGFTRHANGDAVEAHDYLGTHRAGTEHCSAQPSDARDQMTLRMGAAHSRVLDAGSKSRLKLMVDLASTA